MPVTWHHCRTHGPPLKAEESRDWQTSKMPGSVTHTPPPDDFLYILRMVPEVFPVLVLKHCNWGESRIYSRFCVLKYWWVTRLKTTGPQLLLFHWKFCKFGRIVVLKLQFTSSLVRFCCASKKQPKPISNPLFLHNTNQNINLGQPN